MSDRERLERIVEDRIGKTLAGAVASAILADGWTRVPPAPPPVLEVTEEADKAFRDAVDLSLDDFEPWDADEEAIAARAAGLRAAWPILTRSCADGLTDEECWQIAYDVGMEDGARYIREVLRRVAARREA